jgi:hypothetical protein
MGKIIFIFVGLAIGLVASFYYISSSLGSLSANEPAVTVEHLLALTTHEELMELRAAKLKELTEIFKRVTDEPSAKANLSAAQHAFMQLEMINTRARMLPSLTAADLESRFKPSEASTNLQVECRRLSKSFALAKHLHSVLTPLSSQLGVVRIIPPSGPSTPTAPSSTNPPPAPKPADSASPNL